MKLINLQKNNRGVGFGTLFLLEILCVFFFVIIVFLSCLLGRLVIFFKTGMVIFDLVGDIFQSIKVGGVAGLILGVGLWMKARLQEGKGSRK
ncbi:hypothetical protein [Shimwellia blattae]|uniref:hypothetical protein n=1 Tax=Shimwellia blattae TaxID=563 RepID=UPI000290EC66|nr:hypothetical protein [Shimwellia blattae]GAB83245.1 hypothetical protein EB105725_61_00040 [Shimwellia blattae DSM 4481 = NBRC 105725]VDY64289.1 Uncharacterised protein [Shimwellia blattae]VEC22414.1 Uncharacterised protein [Shimwellia blattae]